MAQYIIANTYEADCNWHVELPDGKLWSDVASWFVKWNALEITFKDGSAFTAPGHGETETDMKRPMRTFIMPCDDDGETDGSVIDENDRYALTPAQKAAPELLAEIEIALSLLDNLKSHPDKAHDFLEQAQNALRWAIAKAHGNTPESIASGILYLDMKTPD